MINTFKKGGRKWRGRGKRGREEEEGGSPAVPLGDPWESGDAERIQGAQRPGVKGSLSQGSALCTDLGKEEKSPWDLVQERKFILVILLNEISNQLFKN